MTEESDIFLAEASEILDEIEECLLTLHREKSNSEIVNRIFRAFHTIKGSGSMFGFDQVAFFAHQIENAIDEIRQGRTPVTDQLLDLVMAGRDQLGKMVGVSNEEAEELLKNSDPILTALKNFPAGAKSGEDRPGRGKPQKHHAEPAPTKPVKFSNLKFLIVEDDFFVRHLLGDLLKGCHLTHFAMDGFEAIQALKQPAKSGAHPYDLVLLDIMMPGIDGILAGQEMRRLEKSMHYPPAKIIITSAKEESEIKRDSRLNSSFYDGYLCKPIHRNNLRSLIGNLYPGLEE